jgi:hypothetical protein
MFRQWKVVAVLFLVCLLTGGGLRAATDNPDGYRLSGPVVHDNLAIYFVHGKSRSGPAPLTLQEALAKKIVEVREIGKVTELEVENVGDEEVFIQSGDIVKGGKQDRVLSVSLMIPPHSGAVTVPSFCVESGRWTARGSEDVKTFASARAALPSRAAKIEMAQSSALTPDREPSARLGSRQQEIWKEVAQTTARLSSNLGAPVAAPQSQTSLQLALENSRLDREVSDYIGALQAAGERADDIVGYVLAINGKVNSADIYPSNGLFRKMWPKLLRAGAIEAFGERNAAVEPTPSTEVVSDFLNSTNSARAVETTPSAQARIRKRESARALFLEARPAAAPVDGWVHRNYLAR